MPIVSRCTVGYKRPDNTAANYQMVAKYDSRVARGEKDRSSFERSRMPFRAKLPAEIAEKAKGEYIYAETELGLRDKLKQVCDQVAEQRVERRLLITVRVRRSYEGSRHKRLDPMRTGAELSIEYRLVEEVKTYRGGRVLRTDYYQARAENGEIETGSYHADLAPDGYDSEGIQVFDYTPSRLDNIQSLCLALTAMAERVDTVLAEEGMQRLLDGELDTPLLKA